MEAFVGITLSVAVVVVVVFFATMVLLIPIAIVAWLVEEGIGAVIFVSLILIGGILLYNAL